MSSENNLQKIEITINLDSGFGIKNHKESELIQQDAYNFIDKKVEQRLECINNKMSLSDGVFFINGTRGAGKSAFLSSMIEFIQKNKKKVTLLINIDPTKVETGENILVSIIQKLTEIVDEKFRPSFKMALDQSPNEYDNWRKQLKSLASGISLLSQGHDGIKEFHEDGIALDWGMKKVRSGLTLADSFKKLVEKAQEILRCDAFIIAIDDADTNFNKGKEILELIRRYLDIPQIIIFVAGDLRLYTHLVRNMFADNLDYTDNLSYSSEKKNRIDLLDHMVDQYLKKLFPIQNRIELKTLKILNHKYSYFIEVENKKFNINEIVEKMIKDGLAVKSSSDINNYKDFILSQPIRSIIQLLYLCTSQLTLSNDLNQWNFQKDRIAEAFRHIFLDDLYKHQIDTDGLSNKMLSTLNYAVFDAVIKDGELDTGCYLRPQPRDESLKTVVVALASNVAWQTENNLAAMLDYMLQGIGSQFAFNLCNVNNRLKNDEQVNVFKNYFSLGRNEDALNWAWHYCGSLNFKSGVNRINAGVIGLNIRSPKGNTRKNDTYKVISSVLNNIGSNSEKSLPIIGYSLVQVISSVPELYSSIFNILGLISKILNYYEENEENTKKYIQDILKQQENVVSISQPQWKTSQDLLEELDGNIDIEGNVLSENNFNLITEYMFSWCKLVSNTKISPSAILIGKIWTRLFFSIVNISDKQRNSQKLADIMELYSVAIINSFLIEEIDHHILCQGNYHVDKKNPLTNPEHVINKFKKLESINFKDNFPLTYMMVSCPMLLGLLEKNNANSLLYVINSSESLGDFVTVFSENFDNFNEIYIAAK